MLIKASEPVEEFDEEADFNRKTPRVLSSDEGSDNEEEKENRPLIRGNF